MWGGWCRGESGKRVEGKELDGKLCMPLEAVASKTQHCFSTWLKMCIGYTYLYTCVPFSSQVMVGGLSIASVEF